ncbi:hypothetical protein JKP88DRAFT_322634 [Tribonema minus]|uniref:Nudix hydrolase domain-containing protein n=1 Tax=Tribonema minus TaxID=303371 RepID=A0A835Z2B6_9STRA|nr:hypothetical protein JKP88DRAFT_322634 [Tribonema minus]
MTTQVSYGIIGVNKDTGKVLVILQHKRNGTQYTFPKGMLSRSRDDITTLEGRRALAEAALLRETRLSVARYLSEREFESEYFDGRFMKQVYLWLAEVTGTVRALPGQVHGYEWVAPDALQARLTYREDQGIAERACHEVLAMAAAST